MSTTEALLGNLTEMPVINANSFQILTYFIVLAKKASQPGVDYVAANFVPGVACNEFSVAILERKSVKSFLTI